MAARTLLLPPRIAVGAGARLEVPEIARSLGRRALLVCGPNGMRSGQAQTLASLLSAAGVPSETYSGVNSEPTVEHVAEGAAKARAFGADLVVAIGGGSVLDAAKAIAIVAVHGGDTREYEGKDLVPGPGLALIAIPTTAGTGSEVTCFTVITRKAQGASVKMLIGSPHLVPAAAVVDPELLPGAPRDVMAAAGIDAMTHAIEAYVSRRAQPVTDDLALSALSRIGRALLPVLRGTGGPADRESLMIAAMQAGIAFSNASVALVHGMARPLGAYFDVPHGVANGLLLEEVVRFSVGAAEERYARIAEALGAQSGPEDAVQAISEICREAHLPEPGRYGITPERIAHLALRMADDALRSGSPQNNPRLADAAEIAEIYPAALFGSEAAQALPGLSRQAHST